MEWYRWKWGVRVWIGRRSYTLLGPRDASLFSERYGYCKPIVRIWRWRLFANHDGLMP